MSSVGTDQLLQITTPVRPAQEASRQNETGGDRFRAHLERASGAAETKPAATKDDSVALEEEQQLESQIDQQERSTTQQDEAIAAEDSKESTGEVAENNLPDDQPADDVTLSAAAVAEAVKEIVLQDVEIDVSTEQAAATEIGVEFSTSEDQEQTTQQQAAQQSVVDLTESKEGTSNVGATTEVAITVEANDENEVTKTLGRFNTNHGAERGSAEQEATTEAASESTTQQKTTEVASPSQVKQGGQAIEESQQPDTELPAVETEKSSADRSERKQNATPVANKLTTPADTEIAEVNSSTAPEVNAPSTSTSTGNETTLAAERALGRLLPGKATSSEAGKTETSEAPTVDRARFVQRVGGAIRAAQQNDGQIQLRLSPPELGTLRIDITVNKGVLTAKLEVENSAARTVLLDNLPALRERLAEQEIRIEKFDVDVRRDGQQQSEHPGTEERQANNRPADAANTRQGSNTARLNLAAAEASTISITDDSGLDVRI